MKTALLAVLLVMHCTVFSQKSRFEYGVQGGVNLNTVYGSGETLKSQSRTTGLSLGVHTKWNATAHFGIGVQLSYEQLGWAYRNLYLEDSVNGLVKADIVFKLNYLHLPVLASYSFGKKVKIVVEAGGFAGLLLNNQVVQKRPFLYGRPSTELRYSSADFSKLNAGLAAGAGVQIPFNKKLSLSLTARNYTGLTSIRKPVSGQNASTKTMSFSFLSGLTFRL